MSDAWMQIIFSGLLAWIAWELRSIKKELKTFVLREDCRDDMNHQCSRLDALEERMSKNEVGLSELRGSAHVWHNK